MTRRDLRELARLARLAKAAKGRVKRQVTRANLAAQALTASRVRQAERYTDAESDMSEDARSRLIWDLLAGPVTDDALRAVIGLLHAIEPASLDGCCLTDGSPRH